MAVNKSRSSTATDTAPDDRRTVIAIAAEARAAPCASGCGRTTSRQLPCIPSFRRWGRLRSLDLLATLASRHASAVALAVTSNDISTTPDVGAWK